MEVMRLNESATTSPRKGCNPILATQRSKIHSQRTVINQQLCKQMRLRAGAENLYNASTNQKVKDTVALELSFVNSNLQLLKEELSDLNSSFEPYQNKSGKTVSIPMIPLGLKDTKELDFVQIFEAFLASHYGENPADYSDELADFTDLRNSARTPSRDQEGVNLLLEYHHQLHNIENRFLPAHRPLSVYFHWYDSITGVPAVQRSISLEKAGILFNIGALFSQLGTRSDRSRRKGINFAIVAFQSSAGAFDYVRTNFVNAPTADLGPTFLHGLTLLMLAQAQECVLERKVLGGFEIQLGKCASISQEAMKVSEKYASSVKVFENPDVKCYVPYSWLNMMQAKTHHYRALAHYYAGVGLLEQHEAAEEDEISALLTSLYLAAAKSDGEGPIIDDASQRKVDRRRLGKSHLRQAVFYHERALQTHSLCKVMRTVDILKEYLQHSHNRSVAKYAEVDTEEDFFELVEAPEIQPFTEYDTDIVAPAFASIRSEDIFKKLGPPSIFSAHNRLSGIRTIDLRTEEEKCSFTLQGDSPVTVGNLDDKAMQLGIRNGDVIVSVNGVDRKWGDHNQIADVIAQSGDATVEMKLISVIGSFEVQTTQNGIPLSQLKFAEDTMQANPNSKFNSNSNNNNNNNNNSNGVVVRRPFATTKPRGVKKRHSFGLFNGLKLRSKPSMNAHNNRFSVISERPNGAVLDDFEQDPRRPHSASTVHRSATTAKYIPGSGTILRPKKEPFKW